MPVATPCGGGVNGDFGVFSPEAVSGERGGELSGPAEIDVLLLLRSCSRTKGEEFVSPTTRSVRVTSRAHVTMSVFSSNGRGNLPSVKREEGRGREDCAEYHK